LDFEKADSFFFLIRCLLLLEINFKPVTYTIALQETSRINHLQNDLNVAITDTPATPSLFHISKLSCSVISHKLIIVNASIAVYCDIRM